MGNTLLVEQQLTLCALFIEKDIKEAMFSIPNTKSPGPDGFSSNMASNKGLAHPPTLRIVMNTLHEFYQCAGLQANQAKSQIVFVECNPSLQQQCLDSIGFQEGTLPLRYLRVPITISRLNKLECRALVEKILGKIRLWSTKSISFAVRAQLLTSVMFGMYNY
ncbi:hypothetical protein Cgig2_003075 [Carnegiea gigantea]|uniref:Reverse transcriptase n=1 Tax=Carnegiea gigantea TaxID=171969 RepID=A0A9Q1GUA4_9CARY|nr:hypothetical protein Cgig2_003075 [Carnegiea gigantea]